MDHTWDSHLYWLQTVENLDVTQAHDQEQPTTHITFDAEN